MKTNTNQGFTLIELMIVLAILGILASIAYPSYREAMLKGKRADARAAIADVMQQQERYMTQRNTYLAFDWGAEGVPFKTFVGTTTSTASYNIKAEACTGMTIRECVKISARPVQEDKTAGTLTLTSTGVKACESCSNPSAAWK